MTYSREQRKAAKNEKAGLMTISYTNPEGATVTSQCVIAGVAEFEEKTAKFIKMIKREGN